MYCEIPAFNRCCFCLPLRYGLLAYGYIKLTLYTIQNRTLKQGLKAAELQPLLLIAFLALTDSRIYRHMFEDVIITLVVLMIILDLCLTVVFVFGGHAKKPKLLQIYMWYCLVTGVGFIILQVVGISLSTYVSAYHIEQVVMSSIVTIVIQAYLIISIRSEIIKLVSNKEEAIQYNVYDPSDHQIKLQCGV